MPVTVIADPPEVSETLPLIVTLPVKACVPAVVMLLDRAMALLVRLRALPLVNDVELPTEIEDEPLVKLAVRLLTKLADDVPKLSPEPEMAPELSFMRIEASPLGWFTNRLVPEILIFEADPLHEPDVVMV